MSEWVVVTVIVTLVGLLVAVVSPIVKLNTTITKLNITVSGLEKSLESLTVRNTQNHDRIWAHEGEQDKQLHDHETRISIIEKGQ
jgi:cell division protein FtsL